MSLKDTTGQQLSKHSAPVVLASDQPAIPVTGTLVAGDIQIGAVEIKNGTTDTRAAVMAASTLSVASDTALVVSLRDSAMVRGNTPRLTASVANPGSATQYSISDLVANSDSAASVVPITFTLTRTLGRITGCRCVVTPASSNLVITALDFDLLLFRPATNIPFAAAGYPANNAALAITSAAMAELVCVFRFMSGSWRNPAGLLTAGVAGYQAQPLHSPSATPRPYAPFNVTDTGASTLLGLIQMQAVWNPGAVVNTFNFALDVDLD